MSARRSWGGEAEAAIDKIDEFRIAEVSVAPMAPGLAADKLVKLVEEPSDDEESSDSITAKTLKLLEELSRLGANPSEDEWNDFLSKLRVRYATLSSIFDSIEHGVLSLLLRSNLQFPR